MFRPGRELLELSLCLTVLQFTIDTSRFSVSVPREDRRSPEASSGRLDSEVLPSRQSRGSFPLSLPLIGPGSHQFLPFVPASPPVLSRCLHPSRLCVVPLTGRASSRAGESSRRVLEGSHVVFGCRTRGRRGVDESSRQSRRLTLTRGGVKLCSGTFTDL